jgi:hypothetical protein
MEGEIEKCSVVATTSLAAAKYYVSAILLALCNTKLS